LEAHVRVLIVEDEWLIALAVEQAVTAAGFTVSANCRSLPEAQKALSASAPEVAVLDSNLRGNSAEDIACELRARGIPFLVLSGYSRRQLEGSLARAPFLGKPFRPADLVNALRGMVA
jgi:DNA-binding response OmpR family regulator